LLPKNLDRLPLSDQTYIKHQKLPGGSLKLVQSLFSLTAVAGILILVPAIPIFPQAAQNTTAKSTYDHGLRHFYWLYTYDPAGHQRRDWYQESSSTWNEIYEDGRYNHSLIVNAHAVVDGNTGIIAKAETSTLLLFIPDRDATGSNPQWLRIQQQGASSWTLFAKKFEVDQPAQQIAATQRVEDFNKMDITTLQQRAAAGNAAAQAFLGYRFYNGIDISQDYGQAAIWFRKAADQGRFDAQYFLGVINARGNGIPPNESNARIWFQMASRQGYQPAKDELARLDAQAQQGTQATTSQPNAFQETISSPSAAALSGDLDPIIVFADQASNLKQLEDTLNSSAQTKISLSKEERRSDKRFPEWQKECNDPGYVHTWSTTSDLTAAGVCGFLARELRSKEGVSSSQLEAVAKRACGLSRGAGLCDDLGELYLDRNDLKDALLVFNLPQCDSKHCLSEEAKIYRQIGASKHLHEAQESFCHDWYQYGACKELSAQGEPFDYDAWSKEKNEQRAENEKADRVAERQLRRERAERQQEKDQRNAAILGAVESLANTAVSSYGDYKAGVAQARVNVETARLAQQNKGGGSYSTGSSSSGSSGSGTSLTSSSKPATKNTGTADTSDSTDSSPSSDSSAASAASPSAASSSNRPFNPYTPTSGGYNPYSDQGVPPIEGSTIPGEKGHWAESELVVTCYSRAFPRTTIYAVLVSSPGNPDCNGRYVEFEYSDKTHPLYYGFAGVINERMVPNPRTLIDWGPPYISRVHPNPSFSVRVSIRYFAAD
jgi:uncharacterized protein